MGVWAGTGLTNRERTFMNQSINQSINTIEQVVQALGHKHDLSWLEAIPLVEMTLNNAVNGSTSMSPAFVSYG